VTQPSSTLAEAREQFLVMVEGIRPELHRYCARLTGSVIEGEDIVQDTFLKWSAIKNDEVKTPKAYLVKTVTNLSINYLRGARKMRENYIGLWLPQPLMKEKIIDSFKSIDLYHSLSIGMMVLLEKLSASERAVFLLKEVFS